MNKISDMLSHSAWKGITVIVTIIIALVASPIVLVVKHEGPDNTLSTGQRTLPQKLEQEVVLVEGDSLDDDCKSNERTKQSNGYEIALKKCNYNDGVLTMDFIVKSLEKDNKLFVFISHGAEKQS